MSESLWPDIFTSGSTPQQRSASNASAFVDAGKQLLHRTTRRYGRFLSSLIGADPLSNLTTRSSGSNESLSGSGASFIDSVQSAAAKALARSSTDSASMSDSQTAAVAAARRQAAASAAASAASASARFRTARAFVPRSTASAAGRTLHYLTPEGNLNWGWLILGTPNSPWGYLNSRYAIALVVVVVLINRIQNICRPHGRSVRVVRWKRLAVRAVSLVMLLHATAMLSILTLALMRTPQDGVPPNRMIRMLNRLTPSYIFNTAPWDRTSIPLGVQDRTAEINWLVFLAVISHQVTEVFLATIEARRDEAHSISLFTFSLLLSEEVPSKHTALVALLAVAEITCLALAGSWRRHPKVMLPITTVFSLLALAHFLAASSAEGYPWTQLLTHLPDVAMINVVVMTAILQALTMLLSEGRVDVRKLIPPRTSTPALTEPFSIALFKWGAACVETSTPSNGFTRELAPIGIRQIRKITEDLDRIFAQPHVELTEDGSTEVVYPDPSSARSRLIPSGFRLEIKDVRAIAPEQQLSSGIMMGQRRLRAIGHFWDTVSIRLAHAAGRGLAVVRARLPHYDIPPWVYRFLRRVRLFWHGSNGEARREQRLQIRREVIRVQRRQAADIQQMTERADRITRHLARRAQAPSDVSRTYDEAAAAPWHMLLAPDADLLPDLDDTSAQISHDMWEWRPGSAEENSSEGGDEGEEEEETSEDEGQSGAHELAAVNDEINVDPDESQSLLDLARMGRTNDEDFGTIMLAHLAQGGRPLTRGAYRRQLQGQALSTSAGSDDPDARLAALVRERRAAQPDSDENVANPCAICLSEPR